MLPESAIARLPVLQDFVDEEEIGEQRAEMDRRVEVVDDLRTDRPLREDELNRRPGVVRVVLDHADERVIGRRRLDAEPADESGQELAEVRQRRVAALEVFTRLAPCVVVLIGGKTLGGVREKKLVR